MRKCKKRKSNKKDLFILSKIDERKTPQRTQFFLKKKQHNRMKRHNEITRNNNKNSVKTK